VDEHDLLLRNLTYALFVHLGRAPTSEEVAERAGQESGDVVTGWRRLHDQHALVLEDPADTTQPVIRMANPFSGVPTPFRVQAAGRDWFANCAWDAFGIPAALHADGRIRSTCPDCGLPIDIHVGDGKPDVTDLVFHCLIPAARWWDDIVFT
jgi:hypothetical protein